MGGKLKRDHTVILCSSFVVVLYSYCLLAEVPSVARVLNGLSVDAVYSILLLYPPETPVPSLSCRNLLLGPALPPGMLILVGLEVCVNQCLLNHASLN